MQGRVGEAVKEGGGEDRETAEAREADMVEGMEREEWGEEEGIDREEWDMDRDSINNVEVLI